MNKDLHRPKSLRLLHAHANLMGWTIWEHRGEDRVLAATTSPRTDHPAQWRQGVTADQFCDASYLIWDSKGFQKVGQHHLNSWRPLYLPYAFLTLGQWEEWGKNPKGSLLAAYNRILPTASTIYADAYPSPLSLLQGARTATKRSSP